MDVEKAFWFLKAYFKGDSEFTYEGFHQLPYEYVLQAYAKATEARTMELHLLERPSALLAQQTANLNRDVKKQSKPYTIDQFYLYQPDSMRDDPAERYGAAAVWLAEKDMYPSFALFCFPELRKSRGANIPTLVAFLHESAVLLAPTRGKDGITGLLIAEHSVSHEIITMRSPCGQEITVRLPAIRDEVAAEEDITLELC